MRGLTVTLQLLTVLCLLLLQRCLCITFTPRAPSAPQLSPPHLSSQRSPHLTLPLSAHHTLVSSSTRRSGSNHTFHPLQLAVSNLTGCAAIDFSASVSIDGQGPFRLIVDSGSTTLAVVSSSCTNCENTTPVFTPAASSSANGGAAVSSVYGGNTSWSGHSWRANVSLGDSAAVSMVVATIDSSNGFINGLDVCAIGDGAELTGLNSSQGIIGFAFPSLAVSGTGSWITDYVAATGVSNEFTLQMCPTGGNLWVGGYDPTFLAAPFTYVPIAKDSYYNVALTQIAVLPSGLGATAAPLPFNQSTYGPCSSSLYLADCSIVDSGTSDILLPALAYDALVTALGNDNNFQSYFGGTSFLQDGGNCARAKDIGASMTTLQSQLPQLVFAFNNGATISIEAIPGWLSLAYDDDGDAYYCPALGRLTGGYAVLGAAFSTQFTVRYDLANSRIGFGYTARCGEEAPALLSYSWQVGAWGSCSVPCGGGVQWRQVLCLDTHGNAQDDILCATAYSGARPALSQSCNSSSCSGSASTNITSLTCSSLNLTAGQNATISFTYTGAAPSYLSLYISPLNGSAASPLYIVRNASSGSGGSGSFLWTVPTSASSLLTGDFSLAAYTASPADSFVSSDSLNFTPCNGSNCTTDPCADGPAVCGNRGQCSVLNSSAAGCLCLSGYTGDDCSTPPTNLVCSLNCINGGSVTSSCLCSCSPPYTGVLCELSYQNFSLTLTVPDAGVAESAAFSTTVLADLSFALGLQAANIALDSVLADGNSTVVVSFQLMSQGDASVLDAWSSLLQQQVTSNSGALRGGLITSAASGLTVEYGGDSLVSSSTAASEQSASSAGSSAGDGSSPDDDGDGASGPGTTVYIIIAVVGGVVAVLALLWLLSCLCRGGSGVAEGRVTGNRRKGRVVSVTPRNDKHQLHAPSFDYGY